MKVQYKNGNAVEIVGYNENDNDSGDTLFVIIAIIVFAIVAAAFVLPVLCI